MIDKGDFRGKFTVLSTFTTKQKSENICNRHSVLE